MKITKVYIEKFRGFHQQEFQVGSQITAIAGYSSVSRGGYGGPQADEGEGQTGQDMRSSQIINIRYGAYVPVRVIPI